MPDPAEPPADVVVYGAASLTDALGALADSFTTAYPGYRVVLNVAATSLLARQIEEGAPADVFFSANLDWMERLRRQSLLAEPVLEPLSNRLVVVGREGEPPLDSLGALSRAAHVALADPDHVPAGIYAREGLSCAGLWERIQPLVVPTLDVRAALLSVRNAAAELAVVYASDVQAAAGIDILASWPEECQPSIRYAVARLDRAAQPEGADRFVAYVTNPARAPLWRRYGFLPYLDGPTEGGR